MADLGKNLMQVKIYSPFRSYFEGPAASLSAINKTGPFDILAGHKNFMSLLTPCTVSVRTPGKPDFNLNVSRGVLHVKSNKATVFLDI